MKQVRIIRLVTTNTVEEHILSLAEGKTELSDAVHPSFFFSLLRSMSILTGVGF